MTRPKVLFIDLLYSDGGSLDEDVRSITQAVAVDHTVEYLRFNEDNGYKAIAGVFLRVLSSRYDKVVLLSSKVSQLLLLAPLRLLTKCYAIYHFMPSHRQSFHQRSLKILSRLFVFGVYANGVADQIEKPLGFRPKVLPSRIVDRKRSLNLLREKLAQNQIRVLVPGVRPGVRKHVALSPIAETLEQKLGYQLEGIYIQGDIPVDEQGRENIRKLGKLPQEEYDQFYNSSLIVAVNFHEDYEVRASGVILDALRSGSIVLSDNHPIISQYGYPTSIVTDLKNLGEVLAKINNASDEQALALIPGSDFDDFRKKWATYLN